jgi:hypothetical protein
MKLGVIEVSGAKNVVFYKKNEWIRENLENGKIIWRKKESNRVMPHHRMVEILQKASYEDFTRVWTEGYTINVEKTKKNKYVETKFDDDGNMMFREPDGRWRDVE